MNYRKLFFLALAISPSAIAQPENYKYREFMRSTVAYFSHIQQEALASYYDAIDIKASEIEESITPYSQKVSDCGYRANLANLPPQIFKTYVNRAIEYGDVWRASNDTSKDVLEYYQKDGRTIDEGMRMLQLIVESLRVCTKDAKTKLDEDLRKFSERKPVRRSISIYSSEVEKLVLKLDGLSGQCNDSGKLRTSSPCAQLSELVIASDSTLKQLLNAESPTNPILKYRLTVMRAKTRLALGTMQALR